MKKINVKYHIELGRFQREFQEAEEERRKLRSMKPRAMKLWLEANKIGRELPDKIMDIFVSGVEDKVNSHKKGIQAQKEKRRGGNPNASGCNDQDGQEANHSNNDYCNEQSFAASCDINKYPLLLKSFLNDLSDVNAGENRRSLNPRAMKLWLEAHRIGKKLPTDVMEIFVQAIEGRVKNDEKRKINQKKKRQLQKSVRHRWTSKEKQELVSYIHNHYNDQITSDPDSEESTKIAIYSYIEYRQKKDGITLEFDMVASVLNRQENEIINSGELYDILNDYR